MKILIGRKAIAVQDLAKIGLTLVLLGAVLGVGAYIQTQVATTSFNTVSVKCEDITFAANNTYQRVVYPYIKSVDYMYNSSDCTAASRLLAANYSYSDTSIYLQATSGANFGNGSKYVNYTAFNTVTYPEMLVAMNATSGIAQLTSWIPIIAIVIAASIVIGVLVVSFRGGV